MFSSARIPANRGFEAQTSSQIVHALSGKAVRILCCEFIMQFIFLRRQAVLWAALSCSVGLAQAQSAWVRGEETVVTGQLLREPLAQVLPSYSVITRDDIEHSSARDLFELINGLPGVDATRLGPAGNTSTVSMRGATSAQTLVLVDGVAFSAQGAIGGLSPFEAVPLNLIQRVEILRGNASAQYGPSAVGGVIHIMTTANSKDLVPGGQKFHAALTTGRFGEQHMSAGMIVRATDTELQLSAGKNASRGYDALIAGQYSDGSIGRRANPGPNGYQQQYYNLGLTRQWGRRTEVGLRWTHSRLNTEFDNAYAEQTSDVWNNQTQVNILALHLKHQISDDWTTRWQYNQSQNKQSTQTNGAFNLSYGYSDSSHKSWQWDHTVALSDRHMLSGGLTAARVQLDARHTGFAWVGPTPDDYAEIPVVLKPTLATSRVYAGLGSQWQAWNSQVTLSRDELGQGIGSNNFLLGAGYTLGRGYKLAATRSSALQTPTLGQRYDAAYGGNPELLPERSFSDEVSLQFQADAIQWRWVAFQVRYSNLISAGSQLVADPFWRDQGVYRFENIGQSRNRGYEWESSWRSGPWQMGLGLTWQEPENLHSSIKPINKARRFGNARLAYQVSADTRLSWTVYGSSDRYTLAPGDSSSAPSRTSGYSLHHLSAEHRVNRQLTAKFSLLNAGDNRHSTVAGYAPQPRTWLLGLSYQTR